MIPCGNREVVGVWEVADQEWDAPLGGNRTAGRGGEAGSEVSYVTISKRA